MKKLKRITKLTSLLTMLAILILASSCKQPSWQSSVTSVTCDTSWTTTAVITHTESSNNGAAGGGVLGGTAGWLLVGGPIGVIGGAIAGAAVGSNPKLTTWQESVTTSHGIYKITCQNGTYFRKQYDNGCPIGVGCLIDTRINDVSY